MLKEKINQDYNSLEVGTLCTLLVGIKIVLTILEGSFVFESEGFFSLWPSNLTYLEFV